MPIAKEALAFRDDFPDAESIESEVFGPIATLDPRPSVAPFRLCAELRSEGTLGYAMLIDINSDGKSDFGRMNAHDVHFDSFEDADPEDDLSHAFEDFKNELSKIRIRVSVVGMSQTPRDVEIDENSDFLLRGLGPRPAPRSVKIDQSKTLSKNGGFMLHSPPQSFLAKRELSDDAAPPLDGVSSVSGVASFELELQTNGAGLSSTLQVKTGNDEKTKTLDMSSRGGVDLHSVIKDMEFESVGVQDLLREAADETAKSQMISFFAFKAAFSGDIAVSLLENQVRQMAGGNGDLSQEAASEGAFKQIAKIVNRSLPNRLASAAYSALQIPTIDADPFRVPERAIKELILIANDHSMKDWRTVDYLKAQGNAEKLQNLLTELSRQVLDRESSVEVVNVDSTEELDVPLQHLFDRRGKHPSAVPHLAANVIDSDAAANAGVEGPWLLTASTTHVEIAGASATSSSRPQLSMPSRVLHVATDEISNIAVAPAALRFEFSARKTLERLLAAESEARIRDKTSQAVVGSWF